MKLQLKKEVAVNEALNSWWSILYIVNLIKFLCSQFYFTH